MERIFALPALSGVSLCIVGWNGTHFQPVKKSCNFIFFLQLFTGMEYPGPCRVTFDP